MDIKRVVLTATLALMAGNGLAADVSAMDRKDTERFPATVHQQRLLGRWLAKIGEFARFEATVETPSKNRYQEWPASLNQLQVLGRTEKKTRP
ncbi:hypothetical protein [Methylocaldum szegediense]|jgi:hypothetical protein|uniref:Uncharacterized protein n=1 Tax=Methylocaldum szegediense TaxID=73780 RepID=A0ABM9I4J0_9GAMM|nr:hypothetical protein [Methylocaldum szegediense]CAI8887312.1 conserved exported protein of unknown function [Methylocaldum szegediense]